VRFLTPKGELRRDISTRLTNTGLGMQLTAGGFPRKDDDEQILPNEDGFY